MNNEHASFQSPTSPHDAQLLLSSLKEMIENARRRAYAAVNFSMCQLYYAIGERIRLTLGYRKHEEYGKSILVTLSHKLTEEYGRGYTYSALYRMIKVSETFDKEILATLSHKLSWSHFVELATIEDATKRLYYQQMSVHHHWSLRELRKRQDAMDYERSLIAAKPQDTIIKALSTDDCISNPRCGSEKLLCC